MKNRSTHILQKGKNIYFLLRSDPAASLQLRQLILAICICCAAGYAAHVLLVEPKVSELNKKKISIENLHQTTSANESIILSAQVYSQHQKIKQLQESIAIYSLQEKLLREQWQHQGSNDLFHQTIFTLKTTSPRNMEPHILKMTQGDTRSLHGFDLHPVKLEGRCFFNDFYHYLAYLEESSEIGFLNSLQLVALPGQLSERTEISFTLTLGRLEISHDL